MDLFATWSYFMIRTVRVAMSNKITRPIIKYSKNGCRDSRKPHRSRETVKDEVDAYDYVTYFQRGLLSHEFLCLACTLSRLYRSGLWEDCKGRRSSLVRFKRNGGDTNAHFGFAFLHNLGPIWIRENASFFRRLLKLALEAGFFSHSNLLKARLSS